MSIRITGGRLAGRLLSGPGGRRRGGPRAAPRQGLRPSAARLRASLFAVLAPELDGAVVVDACAGAGTLGFEALSRGAARCLFLERDFAMRRVIDRNAAVLGVRDYEIRPGDAAARLLEVAAAGSRIDLLLCDPPWAAWAGEAGMALLRAALAARPSAAAFEHPAVAGLPDRVRLAAGDDRGGEFLFVRERRRAIGRGAYSLYRLRRRNACAASHSQGRESGAFCPVFGAPIAPNGENST